MKKYLTILITIILIVLLGNYLYFYQGILYIPHFSNEKVSWIENEQFVTKKYNGEIEKFKIKGVNIGLGLPGCFATERGINKETYLKWFRQIKEMGANTIRVYTIQGDDFYNALYEYNTNYKDNPLYLIHGVWLDDEIHMSNLEAHDKKFKENIIRNAKQTIDLIHGKLRLFNIEASGKQKYNHDISKWVIGYILGVEWEGDTVMFTEKINQGMKEYKGKYIYTEEASPFEIFLAEIVDKTISYESRKYGQHRNFALSNWCTTDPLEYTSKQKILNAKYAQVDVEHIKTTEKFKANQFVSYHVYPYYPEFEYDGNNDKNLYKDYLIKINKHHSMPVVISEFGVPSSRGIAAYEQNRKLGRDQGNMTEKEQGNAIVSMYKDIMDSGSAGGIVFIWQDEWFKRTWNTMSSIDLKNTAYWSDYQTNEQYFGLLSFDPGKNKSISYPDGDNSEWTEKDIVQNKKDYSISSKYDEKYMYFMINLKGRNPKKEKVYIPIDTTQKSGSKKIKRFNIESNRGADFIISLEGDKNSKILVQDRYDKSKIIYAKYIYRYYNPFSEPPKKSSDNFVLERMALSELDYFYKDKKIDINDYNVDKERVLRKNYYVLSQVMYIGNLVYGNGNPKSKDFNNLADFCYGKDFIEIRIPWQLLNFYNPSIMQIHDDYYEHYGVEPISIDKMYIGVGTANSKIELAPMKLKGWGKKVTYHERLKESYYILKDYWNNENKAS